MKPIALDLARTAFIPIDLQKGIVENGQTLPYPAKAVVKNNQKIAEALKNTPALMALVNVDYTTPQYLKPRTDQVVPVPTLTPEFNQLVLPIADDAEATNKILVTKYNPGAFFGTDLDLQLRRRKIKTIILSGIASGNGVYTTAIEAMQRGYRVIIIEDASSDRDLDVHHFFFDNMFPKIGRIRSTKGILASIENAKAAPA
ncbi:MAG: isochorismatase family protein [Enterococcus sp.]